MSIRRSVLDCALPLFSMFYDGDDDEVQQPADPGAIHEEAESIASREPPPSEKNPL